MKFQTLDVDPLVLSAQKPTRYVGGELNSSAKDLRSMRATWALCFPETYEVGMSNVGFRLLHHVLNLRPDLACERVFMPWPDMARLMRERGVPLWSIESRVPVRDFDILGFSLQFEAGYTTVLEMLDLAGVPLFASERSERDALVIGGGPCAFNGEPLAPFFDAFAIGEGEEVVGEISDVVIDWKGSGASRAELLWKLAEIPGVYVPSLFEHVYAEDRTLKAIVPKKPGYERISRRVVPDLNAVPQPDRQIVPFMQTVHDRLAIEIQRGCVRGCRFCQAGMLTRPARQRDPRRVLGIAERGLAATGYEEVGFLSLSAGDYACINGVLESFFDRFAPERVAISLPSLRTETMTARLAEQIGKVRKTGFTIAPEAATDRLRRVINKGNSEENLLAAIESAFRRGWSLIKLYFMIGLPTETDEDVEAIAHLSRRAYRLARGINPAARINVSVSTFVPKPFTPFQWEAMISQRETIRRHDLLRGRFNGKGGLALKYHEAKSSIVEGALARGDRRVATAVLAAWRAGQILDGWTEHYSHERWLGAFAAMEREHRISMEFMANRERCEDELLPWDSIDCGVTRSFLLKERARSREAALLEDCAAGKCGGCGACDFKTVENRLYRPEDYQPEASAAAPAPAPAPVAEERTSVRVRYGKTGRAVAVSHLETMTLMLRAVRRSGLPIVYSQGFNPRPRVSFSPACPVGVESQAEFVDLLLSRPVEPEQIARDLRAALPENFPVLSAEVLAPRSASLNSAISAMEYLARLPAARADLAERVAAFHAAEAVALTRERPGKPAGEGRQVDLKAAVLDVAVAGEDALRFALRAGNEASAKPSELLRALLGSADGVRLLKEGARFAAAPLAEASAATEALFRRGADRVGDK
ncbi:MAG: TIGR03960 family B12-binding radical SAM protein [Myxococcales bacterium]